ncbi:glycosyltransferase family 9 protein [Dysgonomonas sp. Marseille-P4677]|uniref:glycosyltransferase family 9 protein n=1 Tax=Dysgonomonas sp. Marseille-P4677 TaxID=2364790 RepID=UPI001913DB9F|nr:glycosyltransferase family 9 protein [Dysgonomonas sp. Marseille-P4677]MBK5720779.1 glycosyltransferase family 9 protein [Dysgonomonas sp. Marseille-P4677]
MSKVLVIRISSFGDVAMLVPVIYSVAAKYPQDRFSVMTRKAFAPLFENLGFNVNVIPLDIKKRHRGIRGYFKVMKRILPMRFTHVADEHDVLRSKAIRFTMRITGHKVAKINKGRGEKKLMIEHKQLSPSLKHTIQRYQEVFDRLGFPAPMTFNNYFDFLQRDFSLLRSITNEKKGKWVGIAPFSKHRGKIYPLEKMEKVIEILSRDGDISIFLFGSGKEEQEVLSLWAKKYPKTIDLTGKLNLQNELLLISYLDIMLSMDSANMHLASLVQVPVVSIWGATHPALGFYGFNQNIENAIQINLDCRPCSVYGEIPCLRKGEDYACMERIKEDIVVNHIHRVLTQRES